MILQNAAICYHTINLLLTNAVFFQGWIDPSILQRTRALLERCKLPVAPPASMTIQAFKDLMSVDKKVQAGKLRLVLLKGPLGGCVVTGDFDPAKLDETLQAFCEH